MPWKKKDETLSEPPIFTESTAILNTTSGSAGNLGNQSGSRIRQIHFGEDNINIETVFGEDDRYEVLDTSVYPFRMICSLDLYFSENGSLSRGTGAFIAPNMLLSCAHNCFNYRTQKLVHSIEVFPGRAGDSTPFNSTWVTRVMYPEEYELNGLSENDIAIFELADPIGDDVGFFSMASAGDAMIRAMEVNLTGYSGDRDQTARTMYTNSSSVWDLSPTAIYYQADTFGGNSGGPVYSYQDGNIDGIPTVFGVHINGDAANTPGPSNGARRIDQDMLIQLKDWAGIK